MQHEFHTLVNMDKLDSAEKTVTIIMKSRTLKIPNEASFVLLRCWLSSENFLECHG